MHAREGGFQQRGGAISSFLGVLTVGVPVNDIHEDKGAGDGLQPIETDTPGVIEGAQGGVAGRRPMSRLARAHAVHKTSTGSAMSTLRVQSGQVTGVKGRVRGGEVSMALRRQRMFREEHRVKGALPQHRRLCDNMRAVGKDDSVLARRISRREPVVHFVERSIGEQCVRGTAYVGATA